MSIVGSVHVAACLARSAFGVWDNNQFGTAFFEVAFNPIEGPLANRYDSVFLAFALATPSPYRYGPAKPRQVVVLPRQVQTGFRHVVVGCHAPESLCFLLCHQRTTIFAAKYETIK